SLSSDDKKRGEFLPSEQTWPSNEMLSGGLAVAILNVIREDIRHDVETDFLLKGVHEGVCGGSAARPSEPFVLR
ncbi:MAG: hypothetical protein KDA36_10580, partial [Planctomycetaceae bacterium]|nr:hypothetical protein [Planctomycetaceae bacterium]